MLLLLPILAALCARSFAKPIPAKQVLDDLKVLYDEALRSFEYSTQVTSSPGPENHNIVTLTFSHFGTITTKMSHDYDKLQGQGTSYTAAEQTKICKAFTKFTNEYSNLLQSITYSFEDFARFGGDQYSEVRLAREEFDMLAPVIIEEVPDCLAGATDDKEKTDVYFGELIARYEAAEV